MGTDLAQKISRAMGIIPYIPLEPEVNDTAGGKLIEGNDYCARCSRQKKVQIKEPRQEKIKGQKHGTAGQDHGPVGITAVKYFDRSIEDTA